jgi:FixJ family two-component response regulator
MSVPQPSSHPVVYIVDDDSGVRDSLGILLRLHGYAVASFESGEAFLASLDQPCTRPSGVVLLDLRLPGMSGAQVQMELAARNLPWPIVILTAHGDVASARNALKAGASDFIEKPIQEPVLLAALEQGMTQQRAAASDAVRKADLERRLSRLTPREREVLAMIVEGRHNREVADSSISTVEVKGARHGQVGRRAPARPHSSHAHIGVSRTC